VVEGPYRVLARVLKDGSRVKLDGGGKGKGGWRAGTKGR